MTHLMSEQRRMQPRRPGRVGVGVLLVLLAIVVAVIVGYMLWKRARVRWALDQGVALLGEIRPGEEQIVALDRWERLTDEAWQSDPDYLVSIAVSDGRQADPRVRALLARATGVDFGADERAWRRWQQNQRRLERGRPPRVPYRQRVRMKPAWTTPIGLTAWYSPILPIDGQIYIGSLGTQRGGQGDVADGVVRVDGQTGASTLIFQPEDGGDVLGLAAGDECLFVALRDGALYAMDTDGEPRWRANAGAPLASIPLSVDINRNGTLDVIVVTQEAEVLAFSGVQGNTVWRRALAGAVVADADSPDRLDVRATLALMRRGADTPPCLLVTLAEGTIALLDPARGRITWQAHLGESAVAGAVTDGVGGTNGPRAYLGSVRERLWALASVDEAYEALPMWSLALQSTTAMMASPRLLRPEDDALPDLLACTAGVSGSAPGRLCRLDLDGVQWRAVPGGAIWATPAVADLNADGEAEAVVASIVWDGDPDVLPRGRVTVFSADGHRLRQVELDAATETSPVVADVDADGKLEVLVADQRGILHCFKTERYGPVQWGLYAGDIQNTRDAWSAFSYGQVPAGLQWRWQFPE